MNTPSFRRTLGPALSAGAFALMFAVTPVAPDTLKPTAAVAASASASSESHSASGHGGAHSDSHSSGNAVGAGASAAGDGSASAHNAPANDFVEGTADSGLSTHAGATGGTDAATGEDTTDISTADGDTTAQISSEGPHPGVIGALSARADLETTGAGAAADGAASASAARLTDASTTAVGLTGSSVGDGETHGLAAALAESSRFPEETATRSFSRARSAISLSTLGGGTIAGGASADTSASTTSTGADGEASASTAASDDVSANSLGDGSASASVDITTDAAGSVDTAARTAEADALADGPAEAVNDGAGTAASAHGAGRAAAEAGIDDETANSFKSVNPSISVSTP